MAQAVKFNTENGFVFFIPPTRSECSLIANGSADPLDGCPDVASRGFKHQSCSHGLDSYICQYASKCVCPR